MKRLMSLSAKFFFLFFIGIACLPLALHAQAELTISGKVLDTTGESVIGASVIVSGTTIGTITDFDGVFQLSNVPSNGTLEISYIGYKTVKLAVKGQTNVQVTLEEDAKALDEVVVVGYGVQRKSDLTGSVVSVKADDLLKGAPTSDISHALQGRMAGVSVVSGSGAPGSGATIRIRGTNSIKADGGPLVVIDGLIGGSLSALNASDIASIEVLKDASATAVYGSRGANGVILVTTKNPEAGRINVQYNGYVNFKTPYDMPDVLDPAGMAELANAYGKEYNESLHSQPKEYYTPEQIADFKAGKGGYDYLGNVFRNTAIEHNHELSISGGNDKTKFLFSGRFNNSQGIVNSSEAQNANYRLKVDTEIRSWLKAGFNFWGNYSKSQGPRFSQYRGVLIESLLFPTTIMPQDEQGNYNNLNILGQKQYNPMGHIWEVDTDGYTYTSRLQGYLDIKIIDGLTLRSTQSFVFGNGWGGSTNNEKSYATAMGSGRTTASLNFKPNRSWNNQNILSYVKEFNKKHRLNATFVFEQDYSDNFQQKLRAEDLSSSNIGYNNLQFSKDITDATGDRVKTSMMSVMARLNYVLLDRYMITASWRYDGSSRLAEGNRWEQFPSVALAWNAKQEHFLRDVDWFSQFKVRVGYGQTGNQGVGPYSAFSEINAKTLPDGNVSFATDRLGYSDLKWERTEQWNAGIDLGFFNNRLTATVDVYHKRTHDMLLDINAPIYTGFSSRLANAGEMVNKGYEITIGADPVVTKNFRWNTALTLSQNKAIVEDVNSDNGFIVLNGKYEEQYFRIIEGERIGKLWGYTCEGIWSTEEAANAPASMNAVPGTYKYKDLNGDNAITAEDESVIGNGQPRFQWGWNNTLSYKGFDLDIFVMGVHGFDVYNFTRQGRMFDNSGLIQLSPSPEWLNRWTPEHQNTDIPAFSSKVSTRNSSSAFVENGSFVKIKNITLGYTLPTKATEKLRISNLRVYASIQNPFMITSYSGMDPEVALKSPLMPGMDWGYYPNGRNYLIGLNFAF